MKRNSECAHELGYSGEQAVAEILRRRLYSVEAGGESYCDLTIGGICRVEVKTATASGRTDSRAKRWQFCLYPHPERQKPFDEDLLILRCETDPPCHFVIPGCAIPGDLVKIDITTHDPREYKGQWAFYRERWDLVDTVLGWCHDAQKG